MTMLSGAGVVVGDQISPRRFGVAFVRAGERHAPRVSEGVEPVHVGGVHQPAPRRRCGTVRRIRRRRTRRCFGRDHRPGRSRTNSFAGKALVATSSWPPRNGCSGSTPSARTSISTTSLPRLSRNSIAITDAPHQKRGDSTQPVSGLPATAHSASSASSSRTTRASSR